MSQYKMPNEWAIENVAEQLAQSQKGSYAYLGVVGFYIISDKYQGKPGVVSFEEYIKKLGNLSLGNPEVWSTATYSPVPEKVVVMAPLMESEKNVEGIKMFIHATFQNLFDNEWSIHVQNR